jgi:phage repressor protein C with HTH and peptisase S24 domain
MEQTGYFERIKEIRTHFGMNKTAFAAHTKVLRSALSEFESGRREPTREFIKTLSDMGISIDWFLSGTGYMLKPTNWLNDEKILHEKANKLTSPPSPDTADPDTIKKGPSGIPLVFDGDKEFEDGIVIPVLEDNPVSAGLGVGIGDDDIPTRFIHAPKELARYLHLMSVPVRGDSMNPTLNDGDMVVCDGGGWDGDGVYVIKTIEEIFVKRVQHTSDGFRIISDNKMYESYTESTERVAIVGKVRAAVVMGPGRRGGV